ncbi:hypothetical protein C8J56DRAFT_1165854 [Mycena floridula]|nr:hypothetical protein C8J56DRAFT_1165854 [Mycena floridula]
MFLLHFVLAFGASSLVHAFSAARNFWPASYPLAVRSPYLNTWTTLLDTNSLDHYPVQWDLASINGWSGLVRVDDVAYKWLGNPPDFNATVLQSSQVTPTRSIFIVVAGGKVQLNITFLSPIEPTDLVKQSLPFCYLAVDVISLDGKPHTVELYSDITAEWISGDRSNNATWDTTKAANSVYYHATRQFPDPMTETANIAEDSIVYYAMKTVPSLSLQSGNDSYTRGQFGTQGRLPGNQDTEFRGISDVFPVFAFSVELGLITPFSSVVWALGLVRDPVIEFKTDFAGTQNRSSFFWTQYSNIGDAIDSFLEDYPNALQRAVALDQQIMGEAQQVSSDYVDLVSLATRQALAVDWTISKTATGEWNMSDVKAFMRDTGGSRRVNAIETLYAALPTYLYLNASWVGLFLDPLLQYQASPPYTNSFAAPDLGSSYPQALGNSDTNDTQSLEDSGDMLVMAWAHATFSGDGTLIVRYYNLLKSWADHLVANTLTPIGQTVDGLTKPNMTNLAIKGIIAIQAMGSISKAVGNSKDADHYSSTASSYVNQWKTSALSSGHIVSTYDAASSSALIYNLFADKLFKFGLIDDGTYAAQTAFYSSQSAEASKFGLAFDNDTGFAKAQWTLFTAATATNTSVRDALVAMVRLRASYNLTAGAFPAIYDTNNGSTMSSTTSGQASPALGAMMSILASNLQNQTITVPPSGGTDTMTTKRHRAAIIAGAVVAVAVAILSAAGAFVCWRRRHRRNIDLPVTRVVSPFNPVSESSAGRRATAFPPTKMSSVPGSSSAGAREASSSEAGSTEAQPQMQNLRRLMEAIWQRGYNGEPPPYHQ